MAVKHGLIKQLIGRPGSKQKIARHITKILKGFDWEVYIEPFCGSCAVYLKLLSEGIVEDIQQRLSDKNIEPIFVLNDKSHEIYNLFKVLREQPDELIKLIDLTPYSRYEHKMAQTIDRESISELERARLYLIDNVMSFGKIEGSSWGYVKQAKHLLGHNQNKLTTTWDNYPERLNHFLSALKHAYIECEDFEKVCNRFDGNKTIHYLDPPYYGKEYYYQEKFTKDDHIRLANLAHELIGQVVISYYPVPEILELYPDSKWDKVYINSISTLSNSNTCIDGNRIKKQEMVLVRK